ncbi:7-cyano-7-deazaguanine synthase QueC [bacterium]|nr:7-cyano-7-deazaguanine synthase QueC [bacterium]
MPHDPTALVLLSGGQDSTTCLFWAKERFTRLQTLCFDYGQRHRIELVSAARIARMAGSQSHSVLPIPSLAQLGGNALTDSSLSMLSPTAPGGLPATFVPARNLLFLTIAGGYAWQHGIRDLVIGVCETDYSGYPDCRSETIVAQQQALRLGLDAPDLNIHTPLMSMSKADTVRLARSLPGCWDALAWSHSCYEGRYPPCAVCPACGLRAKGFNEAGEKDPLLIRGSTG